MPFKFSNGIKIFIFSRSSSKRLKRKFEQKIGKESILDVLILRLKKHFKTSTIKLCVPKKDFQEYMRFKKRHGLEILTGPEEDLIKRTLINAKNLKAIIRLTADDPLVSQELIKNFITIYNKKKYDYIYSTDICDGMVPELISIRYLKRIYSQLNDKNSSNYLTHYLLRDIPNFSKFNKRYIYSDVNNVSLTIDYKKDLISVNKLFEKLKNDIYAPTSNIINIVRKNKSLFHKFKLKKMITLKTNFYDVTMKGDKSKKIKINY